MADPLAKILGEWSINLTIYSVLLRLGIALVIGALMGFERSSRGHVAGIRTYILISLSCCCVSLIDTLVDAESFFLSGASLIAVAIIGTSSITMSSKSRIKGLTTTVGLLAIGALGIASGSGAYSISIIGIIILMVSLVIFVPLEVRLKEKSSHMLIHLELNKRESLSNFTTTIRKLGMTISDIEVNKAYLNTSLAVYTVSIDFTNKNVLVYKKHQELIDALKSLEYVIYIEELV